MYMGGVVLEGGASTGGAAAAGAQRVGTFRSWGWTYDPAAAGPTGSVANAVIELAGRGQVVMAGSIVANRVAIIGGTGEFRGANGQAELVPLGGGAYRAILDYSTPYAGT